MRKNIFDALRTLSLVLALGLIAPLVPAQVDDEMPEMAEDLKDALVDEGFEGQVAVSAAQKIADIERQRQKEEFRRHLAKIDNLLTYEYKNMRGPTEADVIRDASVRALQSAAARLYFDDYIILGRHLLEPYLKTYGERFVVRRTVLSRRIMSDGRNELDVRIGVDVERFYDDLMQKHFLGKPEFRPIMATTLKETIDGEIANNGLGRRILANALEGYEARVDSDRMGPFPLTVNALSDEQTFRNARNEAQRGAVEVLVTGALEVNARGEREILYDNFYFFGAHVRLVMIRVDTGEVLARTNRSFASSALSVESALEQTYEGLMPRAAAALMEGFQEKWQRTMLDEGDYRIMVTGASEETLEGLLNVLSTVDPDVETYVKAFYGDTAVVNVFHPGSRPGEVEERLRNVRVPQFSVKPLDKRRFELKVLN